MSKAIITAAELAAKIKITPADLRKHLRALGEQKPEGGWKFTQAQADKLEKKILAHIEKSAKAPKPSKKSEDAPPSRKKKKKGEEDSGKPTQRRQKKSAG